MYHHIHLTVTFRIHDRHAQCNINQLRIRPVIAVILSWLFKIESKLIKKCTSSKLKIIHLLILTLIYQNVRDTFMNSSINMKFTNYINLLNVMNMINIKKINMTSIDYYNYSAIKPQNQNYRPEVTPVFVFRINYISIKYMLINLTPHRNQ